MFKALMVRLPRWAGVCFFLLGRSATVLPQTGHEWVHPSTYFEVANLSDFVELCHKSPRWDRASLLTEMPSGRWIGVQALRDANADSSGFFLNVNGDMRWVVHSSDCEMNLSTSFVEGYNGGALDLVWNGQLHSVGGYGLWRRHFDLLRFEGGELAWQLLPTNGPKPPDRDKDRSRLFFSGQDVFLLLEKGTGAAEYGKSIYDLYVLNLATRVWHFEGAVDARIGQLDRSVSLGKGMIASNLAGELMWLDFQARSVSAIPNAADILETFQGWNWMQQGRMTWVSDSLAWHEFQRERLELDIPWERLNNSPSFPMSSKKSQLAGAEELSSSARGGGAELEAREEEWEVLLDWLPWSLLLLVLGRSMVRNRVVRNAQTEDTDEKVDAASNRISPLTARVLEKVGSQFETEQLDELLGIDHLSSPETLRSQRARIISKINTEHRVLAGKDLIVRRQSQEDRRRSVYFIGV
jgi:hypothetical protein